MASSTSERARRTWIDLARYVARVIVSVYVEYYRSDDRQVDLSARMGVKLCNYFQGAEGHQ